MNRLVIDAGHGGTTARGRSTPGLAEKDLVLDVARAARQRLGSRALLTRDRDVNLSIGERIGVARSASARAFVSVHANPNAACDEIFVHSRAGVRSRELAFSIARAFDAFGGSARVMSADLAVLSPEHHQRDTAACLVELSDPRAIERYGRAIADALETIGTNDMTLVADERGVPYRYIARLTIGWKNDKAHGHMNGTGTLIWPDMILTAGHNLRREMGDIGRPSAVAEQIEVRLAGLGPYKASGWWAHPKWLNAANDKDGEQYDYGLIKLSDSPSTKKMPDGDRLESWATGRNMSFDRVDPSAITTVHVAGWGSDPCVQAIGGTYPALVEATGTARPTASTERVLGYDADTCGEQSGGPVWIESDGAFTFVGVHHGGWMFEGTQLNGAMRLTREMLNAIDDVMNNNRWRTEGP